MSSFIPSRDEARIFLLPLQTMSSYCSGVPFGISRRSGLYIADRDSEPKEPRYRVESYSTDPRSRRDRYTRGFGALLTCLEPDRACVIGSSSETSILFTRCRIEAVIAADR
ncbi:hypothetical protein WAI453_005211 [Rhynchosporium graminicola]